MSLLSDVIWNLNGFDDLKKFCHKNNDFLRDVSSLLVERVKLEQLYAESLTKISAKARKICGDVIGSLKTSWDSFALLTDMEATIHKELSSSILEEIAKPLKTFADTQKEARKPAELVVDKAGKGLVDKRGKEAQAKKIAFGKSKESENLILQLESSRAKTLAEKELTKLDAKCKKAEESVEKSDIDYINKLIEAERARLALDSAITSSANVLQTLEEEKVVFMKNLLTTYTNLLAECFPKLDESVHTFQGSVQEINPSSDLQSLIETRGPCRQPAEQLIFSCYEEDLNNTIDETRRKFGLENKLKKIMKALQGESKARRGLHKLSTVYNDNPNFSTLDGQQDVSSQLHHSDAVIDLLDASVYRLGAALGKLGQYEAPNNRLAPHIEEKRDKLGLLYCTLRVPLDEVGMHNHDDLDNLALTDASNIYSGLNYDDFDEADDFDDVEADFVDDVAAAPPEYTSIDMCQADYEYVGQENDELTINVGDVITITQRHDDGWWRGELKGREGLFPASYVHQL